MTTMTAPSHVISDLDSLSALRHSRPQGMLSLNRFLRRFSYTPEQLESLSGMPPDSARSNPFAGRLQRFMSIALQIVSLRMLQANDLDDAIAWFKQESLERFGGHTPEQLVASGRGPTLVHWLTAQHASH